MQDLGIVQSGSTVRIMFVTRNSSGGAVAPSTAFENADIEIYKNGGAVQRASDVGITMTSPFDTVTGLHLLEIDLSDNTDAGFWSSGSNYHVTIQPDETVDGQTVVEVLAQFSIESATQEALRRANEALFPTAGLISTVTSNSTTAINVTDIYDAQTQDLAITGQILMALDVTDNRIEIVRVSSTSAKVATVERVSDGSAMSFTVTAGDYVWPIAHFDNTSVQAILTDTGTTIPATIATIDANVDTLVSPYITGAAVTGTLTTTVMTSDLTGYLDDELVGRTIVWTGGTAAGQAARVLDYASASGTVTYTTIATAPTNTDSFVIV